MYALLSATHSITTDLVAPSLATGAQALTSAVLGVALTVCTRTLLVLKYALSKAARRATPSRIKRDIVEIESSGATTLSGVLMLQSVANAATAPQWRTNECLASLARATKGDESIGTGRFYFKTKWWGGSWRDHMM